MTDYKTHVLRTMNPNLDKKELLNNAALGLTGEAGEFADLIKKHLFHGHELARDKAILEIGDLLWYIEMAAHALEITTGEIKERNVEKLNKRYPNGFSSSDSINRKE